MKPIRKPDRATVERIIKEEARRFAVPTPTVWGISRRLKAVQARRAAILRIIEETGCSERGLARVWGIASRSVRNAVRGRRQIGPYDEATLARLTWLYGAARARAIAAGRDFATQADLARWRNLGRRRAA